ncbi:hypothetical protein AZOA_31770 [Azoarcus sp. Aa7]|nr:hypothetical protein [Azoarcus sp. Aa7]
MHQVSAELARLGNAAGDQIKQTGALALERLIDQELMVAQAEEQKIDRDPAVMAAVDAVRREVLARAYVERLTAQTPTPSTAEVQRFYLENPELFSKRRVYALRELRVSVPVGRESDIRAEADKAVTLDDVAVWLRREQIPFKSDSGVRPAEDLPLDALKRLATMREGQLGVLSSPGSLLIVQVIGAREQPVEEASAAPLIERYLTNRAREKVAREALRDLRQRAAIEYVGEFDTNGRTAEAAPASGSPATTPATQALSPTALDKGVGGLR